MSKKKITLKDLFISEKGNFDIQAKHINGKGEIVISSGDTNNGIIGRTNIEAKVFSKGTMTVDMFGNVFYRNHDYKMVTHSRVFNLVPINFSLDIETGLYFVSQLFYLKRKYNYSNVASWNKIKSEKIILPVHQNGDIAFEYMKDYIKEMELQNINKLQKYLISKGIDDYRLTEEEYKIIEKFKIGGVEYKQFTIGEIFEILPYKKNFDSNKVKLSKKGFPYVVRTSTNNGIHGYIKENKKYLNSGKTISFGQDTATMFYQDIPYFTSDKIKIMNSKLRKLDRNNALFLITSMNKAFQNFSWGSSRFSVEVIKKQMILLPMKNNKPNFELMEKYIKATHKLIIKDLLLWADKKLL